MKDNEDRERLTNIAPRIINVKKAYIVSGYWKERFFKINLPANHMHLMLKEGQTVSNSIAELGVNLNALIMDLR